MSRCVVYSKWRCIVASEPCRVASFTELRTQHEAKRKQIPTGTHKPAKDGVIRRRNVMFWKRLWTNKWLNHKTCVHSPLFALNHVENLRPQDATGRLIIHPFVKICVKRHPDGVTAFTAIIMGCRTALAHAHLKSGSPI